MFLTRVLSCFRLAPLVLLALFVAGSAQAQVKRTFSNMSFESPALDTVGCRVYIPEQFVQGWSTDHAPYQSENSGGCSVPAGFVDGQVQGGILEIWRGPRSYNSGGAVNGRQGVQFAEINAEFPSRIYQNVCLIQDEPIRYRFSHRGRWSSSVRDVMTMHVGAGAGSAVITVGTTNTGATNAPAAHQGTHEVPVPYGGTGWVDYSGQFIYAGVSSNTNIGFEAVSAAGGATSGNFLDEIQVELAPFVDFASISSSTPESNTLNVPAIRVNGTIATPIQVRVDIVGGSAELGVDYEFLPDAVVIGDGTLLVTIPAGTHDWEPSGQFPLPIQVIDNEVVDGNRDIRFEIQPADASQYLLASSTSCGGAVNTGWTYNIIDDDATVVVVKSLESVVQVDGDPARHDLVYRIAVSNPSADNVAVYTLLDRPEMDPDVGILEASSQRDAEDPVTLVPPAGGSAVEWLLADGRELEPGAQDVYTLRIQIGIERGGSTANDACAGPGTGLYNLAAATVAAEDEELTSSACQPTPTPIWVSLDKQLESRAVAGDQVEVRIYAAGINQAQARTSGTALPATADTGLQVFPAGDSIGFAEVVGPDGNFDNGTSPGNYLAEISCTNAASGSETLLPSGTGVDEGNRQFWGAFATRAGDDIACTIRNRSEADVSVVKTADPDEAASGDPVEYALLVANAGPGAADGTVLRDPEVAGLGCTELTCGDETGGAVCPVAPAVADLQSAQGVVIQVLPANSSLTFRLGCTLD